MKKLKQFVSEIAHNISHFTWNQLWVMLLGHGVLALGVALFQVAGLGNHPFHSMLYAAEAAWNIPYARLCIYLNILLLGVNLAFGKRFIGLGTLVNMFLLGYMVTFFYELVLPALHVAPSGLVWQIVTVVVATFILALGVALIQAADMGLALYDALPVIASEGWKLPFMPCRVALDVLSFIVTLVLHGQFGIGTVICVFCTGPFIRFAYQHIGSRLVKHTADKK